MFKLIKRFFSLDPASVTLAHDYRKEGNRWLADGNLNEAEKSFRQAININPNQSEAYVNLGFVLSEQQHYEEAIKYLKKGLSISPNNLDATYLLGIIAQHQSKTQEAISYFYLAINIDPFFDLAYQALVPLLIQSNEIEKAEGVLCGAVAKNPQSADMYFLLGEFYLSQHKLDKAVESFNAVLSIQPDQPTIHCKLADIFQQQKRLEEAATHYQEALRLQPEYVDACHNLGAAFLALDKTDEAIKSFERAIAINPNNAQLYFSLGNTFKELKNYTEAEKEFKKAIKCDDSYADAYHHLGMVYQEQGNFDAALINYQKALSINPNFAEVEYCLSILFHHSGCLDKAVEHGQRAVSLKTDYSDAYNHLGNIFKDQGRLNLALAHYEKAIFINQNSFNAYNDLGIALQSLNQFEKAIEFYRKAISLKPDFGKAYNNLASALSAQGFHDEAFRYYKIALSMLPDNPYVLSGLLFLQSISLHVDKVTYRNELNAYGSCVLQQSKAFNAWLVQFDERDSRPLRIGLVSGDLRKHPVGYFLENVVKHLDAHRLQLLVYSTLPNEDELTQTLKSHCVSWVDISHLSDEVAAKQIRDQQVDILIDLAGHTGGNRLAMFGFKPAPVQVTWLGYWASTGVSAIDYVLADKESLPASLQDQFTEKVWYLPNTRMCFSAPRESIAVSQLPTQHNGYITFGSFQNMSKINDDVLALWSKVLEAIPTARLRLQNKQLNDESMQQSLKDRLSKMNIASERVTMLGSVSRQRYLEAHSEVDIVLDTFPFSGGTTTCEALWMGVPTITLAGQTMIARQGASMLTCAGLKDWVASTGNEYINIAINKASDINALAELRARLRSQVQASPLFDASTFARNLENALHDMWEEKIRSINV